MSDSTFIAADLKLTGMFHAPGQTVVIAGQFEGEMIADAWLRFHKMPYLKG